jgi:hypothetical protein
MGCLQFQRREDSCPPKPGPWELEKEKPYLGCLDSFDHNHRLMSGNPPQSLVDNSQHNGPSQDAPNLQTTGTMSASPSYAMHAPAPAYSWTQGQCSLTREAEYGSRYLKQNVEICVLARTDLIWWFTNAGAKSRNFSMFYLLSSVVILGNSARRLVSNRLLKALLSLVPDVLLLIKKPDRVGSYTPPTLIEAVRARR